jgi:PhzF family phenazine biosynthesis protein
VSRPIYVVDAFTRTRYGGNPAAVCIVEDIITESEMAAIAAEMNLSETAFVQQQAGGVYSLRWFTPQAEVELCGHATLAAAHVLWESGRLEAAREAAFDTLSGRLTAIRNGEDGTIAMNFPAEPPLPVQAPQELLEGLGLIPRYVGRNRMDYIVEIDGEGTVRTLRPDFGMLKRLDARGVVVTSRADSSAEAEGVRYDFVSRAFYPILGVDEDPVTGSAHCALAPYWAKRLRRTELAGYQASARGGLIGMSLREDRVLLSGHAVTVLRGEIES